jgi:hypothetical protein
LNRKGGTIPTNLRKSPILNVGYPKVNVRTIVVDVVVAAVEEVVVVMMFVGGRS